MKKFTVEVAYPAFATYDIEAESPRKAMEIAIEKDMNCEKNIEICFECDPEVTVMNQNSEIIQSFNPTYDFLHDTLYNITQSAAAKFKNDSQKTYDYLHAIGFSDDLLEYFHIKH